MASERASRGAKRAAPVVVPAGMAVVTWLVLLIAAGIAFRLDDPSPSSVVPFLFVGLMLWPLAVFAPWRRGVTDRLLGWAARRRRVLIATAAVAALPAIPGANEHAGLLVDLLQLPYRASGILFGAAVFYRERVGAAAARALLRFGQWYFQAIWLYGVAAGAVGIAERVRGWR